MPSKYIPNILDGTRHLGVVYLNTIFVIWFSCDLVLLTNINCVYMIALKANKPFSYVTFTHMIHFATVFAFIIEHFSCNTPN